MSDEYAYVTADEDSQLQSIGSRLESIAIRIEKSCKIEPEDELRKVLNMADDDLYRVRVALQNFIAQLPAERAITP